MKAMIDRLQMAAELQLLDHTQPHMARLLGSVLEVTRTTKRAISIDNLQPGATIVLNRNGSTIVPIDETSFFTTHPLSGRGGTYRIVAERGDHCVAGGEAGDVHSCDGSYCSCTCHSEPV
jgi:hypothetical protein